MADERDSSHVRDNSSSDANTRPRTPTVDHTDAPAPPTPSTVQQQRSRAASGSTTMSNSGNLPQRTEAQEEQASRTGTLSTESLPRRPKPNYGAIVATASHPRASSQLSPSTTMSLRESGTPRRPPTLKRNPSSHAPYRGQAFSVDDDPTEVNEDLRLERQTTKLQERKEQERQLKRQQSTLRRRPTAAQPPALPRVESSEQEEDAAAGANARTTGNDLPTSARGASKPTTDGDPSSDETLQAEEEEEEETTLSEETPGDDDDSADLSDAESFTLKDRQQAINETHPFGIRIWKPALYKKDRSVQRNAEGDIHSTPGGHVSNWLFFFNCLWTAVFGWWLALVALTGALLCLICSLFQLPDCKSYGRVLLGVSRYLFYPFGRYVKLEHDEDYLEEDEGEGRSIGEYERWQTGEIEEGRLFFGPTDISRSLIGRRRGSVDDEDESTSLLGRQRRDSPGDDANGNITSRTKLKKRLFGRGKWTAGRVIFFGLFYFLLAPLLFLVSGICWFLVFSIPMGKVTLLLFYHLRRHPLALSFHADANYSRAGPGAPGSSILMCTYRAVGWKYWKYTIDGTNIFLINLLGLVVFTILDYFLLSETLHIHNFLTSDGLVFVLGLASIIPLAYFIGQAVASISAQSSMGLGATINAFFSTVVEVFLYCVALNQGKSQLVEGSIIGSIFAGILFLPGLSMCFGALKRKTQRFNVKSAGVTQTMLLFSVIGVFGPTLFYQIYGSHELNCFQCTSSPDDPDGEDADCRRCYFSQVTSLNDRFWLQAVRPYTWIAAVLLFLSYVIGLLFTLRTHAAVIWNDAPDEKKEMVKAEQNVKLQQQREGGRPGSLSGASGGNAGLLATTAHATGFESAAPASRATMSRQTTSHSLRGVPNIGENVRDSQMYKRVLQQSLRQAGLDLRTASVGMASDGERPHLVPRKTSDGGKGLPVPGLSIEDNRALVQQVAEIAASAATFAARDATSPQSARHHRRAPTGGKKEQAPSGKADGQDASNKNDIHRASVVEPGALGPFEFNADNPAASQQTQGQQSVPTAPDAGGHGGHDAPNWSRTKSSVILLTATLAYAVIAEILVDTVDAVLSNISIDQKFLGITLFALVPNTTEFLNAISFAMNGNIALSMEIGSAYALQVILLQIPALVLYSAVYGRFMDVPEAEVINYTFNLVFPQWDMVTVILAVFLMGYVLGEGKSNYFKGSCLILTYLVVVIGFWFSGYNDMDTMGVNRFDTLALGSKYETYRTIGQGRSGRAYPVGN